MRAIWITTVALSLAFAAQAHAPAVNPVAAKNEPHHHLVLENEYVRVLRFELSGHNATLLHAHDLPYVSVALGPADFIDAVTGKPEAHVTLKDDQVVYSKGGFAHVVRTKAGARFQNFTVELLKPQGAVRNLCVKVVADAPNGGCEVTACYPSPIELFETDEMRVVSVSILPPKRQNGGVSRAPELYLVLDKSELTITIPGSGDKTLRAGEALWLPAFAKASLANPGTGVSQFLVLTFQ